MHNMAKHDQRRTNRLVFIGVALMAVATALRIAALVCAIVAAAMLVSFVSMMVY